MNYINKGKRDILIFPEFDNVEKIQNIRAKYDELYNICPPHITVAFPFNIDISNKDLKIQLKHVLSKYQTFKIVCEDITFHKDTKIGKYYIFLNIKEGSDIINNIHKDIYEKVLKITRPIEYVPHITLGTVKDINDKIILEEKFISNVDKFIVESIGENEESLIEFQIEI